MKAMKATDQLTGLQLKRLLGKGAFASVYLCTVSSGSNVSIPGGIKQTAIKVLHPANPHCKKADEAESMLMAEAQAMMACSRQD